MPELAWEIVVLSEVTREALAEFNALFGTPGSTGAQLVVDHVRDLEDPVFIAASVVGQGQEFINALAQRD